MKDAVLVEFRTFGSLGDEDLQIAERHLGFGLPEPYRRWLAATGGGDPVRSVTLPHVDFLWEHRAYGVRPNSHLDDIVYLYSYFRDRFTAEYLPVAPLSGGLLVLKVHGDGRGSVWFWNDDSPLASDEDTPEDTEHLLVHCADDWDQFLNRLDWPAHTDKQLDRMLRERGIAH